MNKRKVACPKCGDTRVNRVGAAEFEELHCETCGCIVYLGLLRQQRDDQTTAPGTRPGLAA